MMILIHPQLHQVIASCLNENDDDDDDRMRAAMMIKTREREEERERVEDWLCNDESSNDEDPNYENNHCPKF